MKCSSCGADISKDARFCQHCGTRQAPAAVDQSNSDISEPVSADPPVQKGRPWLWVAIVAAVFIAMLVYSAGQAPKTVASADQDAINRQATDAMAGTDSIMANTDAAMGPEAKPSDTPQNWAYSTDVDKVRGATTYYAETTSTNTIAQSPPYDSDTNMRLVVRKSQKGGSDVLMIISSGQMMCPSYEGCSATVRFDDRTPERISLNGPADNSSETVFVAGASSFIAKLKRAKRVVVEKTLYQAGEPQFEFDVSNLKWNH